MDIPSEVLYNFSSVVVYIFVVFGCRYVQFCQYQPSDWLKKIRCFAPVDVLVRKLKIVPEMTCNVSSRTLNRTQLI